MNALLGSAYADPRRLRARRLERARSRLRVFTSNRLALIGAVVVLVVVIATLAAPAIAPYPPNDSVGPRLAAPDAAHLFGLDDQGRDILSRVLWGGRNSLLISVIPVLIAAVIAAVVGIIAGLREGVLSGALMRATDIVFSFPMILFAISLSAIIGRGIWPVFWTVVVSSAPYLVRVVYTEVKAEALKEYIEAAKALGARPRQIVFRELLPNVISPILVYGTTLIGAMVAFSSGLSFLGIGVQPPEADWGRMVSEGAQSMITGTFHVATFPGLTILLVALSFNWIGDGIDRALDPRS